LLSRPLLPHSLIIFTVHAQHNDL
jgi:hypothetical protein